MRHEQWRDIVGYGGKYQVSDYGRVMSFARYPDGRILATHKCRSGYIMAQLHDTSRGKMTRSVHSLVAEAFIGAYPDGMEVHHIDSDKTNNSPENLEYVTRSENFKHALAAGLIRPLGAEGIIEIRRLLATGDLSQREIGEMFGVCTATINRINNEKTWGWLE